MDLDAVALHAVLLAAWKQHAVRAVRVEGVGDVGDAHRKRRAELLRDLPEPFGALERTGLGLPDREERTRSFVHEVEHGSEPIGTIGLAQPARQPQAAVGAADTGSGRVDAAATGSGRVDAAATGSGRVDAAATGLALMNARLSAELPDLVHAQDAAAERTGPAAARRLARAHGGFPEPILASTSSSRFFVSCVSI